MLLPLLPIAHSHAADTPEVLYRVNAGGPELAAIDAGPDGEADVEQYVTGGSLVTAADQPVATVD